MLKEKGPFEIYKKPRLQNSSLVVGWAEDAGKLGSRVIDYLGQKLGARDLGEIDPEQFFPLGGITVEDDIAQFPVSKFSYVQGKNLVFLKSSTPRFEWHKYMNTVLDVAEQYCHVKEIYTVGSMISLGAHTTPRELLAVANSTEMKKVLAQQGAARDIDYESPPGQRPTLNAFLMWVATRRSVAAAGIWAPVPFYLVSGEDPRACRRVLEFFDKRFGLGLDFTAMDGEVAKQNEKMARLTSQFPEISSYIRKLESNVMLSPEENGKLVKEVEEFLRKRD